MKTGENLCITCISLEDCTPDEMDNCASRDYWFYEKEEDLKTEFFLHIIPPTTTHQQKAVTVVNGKPVFYEPAELKAARAKLMAHLGKHVPNKEYVGAVRLITKWCFPVLGKHRDGEYKITKPDTDNLQKLLKDVMTDLGFWKDDAQVASEITEKFWAEIPGIYIRIEELEE